MNAGVWILNIFAQMCAKGAFELSIEQVVSMGVKAAIMGVPGPRIHTGGRSLFGASSLQPSLVVGSVVSLRRDEDG